MITELFDLVKETSTTTGFGALTVDGADSYYESFNDTIGDGGECVIHIRHRDLEEWEICESVYTHGSTSLSRGALLRSSTGSRIDFSAGTKYVFLVVGADRILFRDANGAWRDNDQILIHTYVDSEGAGTGTGDNPIGNNLFVGPGCGNFTIGAGATTIYEGSYNTGLGVEALASLTTGSSNIGIGYRAGRYAGSIGGDPNETSEASIYIGRETIASADGNTNEIIIGYQAEGQGSNTVVLGNDSIVTTYLQGDVRLGNDKTLLIYDATGSDFMRISHDGTYNLFETNAGAFNFTGDSSLGNATIVVDIFGVGTGNGKMRIWDDEGSRLELSSSSNVGLIEVIASGTATPGPLYLNYSGTSDVRCFYGTTENPFFRVYGYDGSTQKQILFWIGSDGTAKIGSSTGEEIVIMPTSNSSYQTVFGTTGIVTTPSDIVAGGDVELDGQLELPDTTGSAGRIILNGYVFAHAYEPSGGSRNTFLGRGAGSFSISHTTSDEGWYNVGLGYNACPSLTTGSNNVCIGASAGADLDTGNTNMFVGFAAGFKTTSGTGNVGFGPYGVFQNLTGSYNVGIGIRSLYNATGAGNIGIGRRAGYTPTSGSYNVWLGYYAGNDAVNQATSPNYSIAIGYATDTGGNYAIAIGYGVVAATSEVVIGSTHVTRTSLQGDLCIDDCAKPTANGGSVISVPDNGSDPTMASNTAGLYAKDVSGTVELFAVDEAGNATQISPHDPVTGDWIFYSKNRKTGKTKRVNMERLVKAVEELTGENFLEEWTE
jgi:hypothetical protein